MLRQANGRHVTFTSRHPPKSQLEIQNHRQKSGDNNTSERQKDRNNFRHLPRGEVQNKKLLGNGAPEENGDNKITKPRMLGKQRMLGKWGPKGNSQSHDGYKFADGFL